MIVVDDFNDLQRAVEVMAVCSTISDLKKLIRDEPKES